MPYIVQWQVITLVKIMIKEVSASLIFFYGHEKMKKQLTFYFIRHGKTVWNTEGLMQGHGDSP